MAGQNVLIVMSDEHTRSVMGAYGNSIVQTPNLDRLAAEGIRFQHAYTPSPICIPARASFATGQPVFEHRCWSSAEPYHGQRESWMHRLRARGHQVTSIGKLHYRAAEDDCGFSESLLPMYLANGGFGWPQGLQRKPMAEFDGTLELAAKLGPGETEYTRYDRNITSAAVDWLEHRATAAERPWVLFVSFISPHFPLSAPEAYYRLYADRELPEPFDRNGIAGLRHPVFAVMREFWDYADHFDAESEKVGLRNYYGLCSFLDDNVGQVLAALERSRQAHDTVVIYTSDHGDMIGNHGIWGKSYMYEDSAGIPMVLRVPGVEPAVNPTAVSLNDIAATVELAVTGETAAPGERWRGRPLQDFIAAPELERPVLSEYHDGGSPCGFYMLRRGRWKLVYFSEGYAPQLFDLERDPRELDDLAADPLHAGQLENMTQVLKRILDPETVNRKAFEDQARMIEKLGGLEAIHAMRSFNHTPLETA